MASKYKVALADFLRDLQTQSHHSEAVLKNFSVDLLARPAHAFQWAQPVLRAAAKLDVLRSLREDITHYGQTMESEAVLEAVMTLAWERARYVVPAEGTFASMVAQEVRNVWTEIYATLVD